MILALSQAHPHSTGPARAQWNGANKLEDWGSMGVSLPFAEEE